MDDSNDNDKVAELGAEAGVIGVSAEDLTKVIERVERLEEEKRNLQEDIKEVFSEASSGGFDTKIIKKIISRRKRDPDEVREEEAILGTYLRALGDE